MNENHLIGYTYFCHNFLVKYKYKIIVYLSQLMTLIQINIPRYMQILYGVFVLFYIYALTLTADIDYDEVRVPNHLPLI